MSWLYSQALVAEYLEDTCSDGAPFAPLSVMPTPHKFWHSGKTMDALSLSRFGLTCAVLTEDLGRELLTLFLADSRARTSAQPEKAPGSTASEAGFGEKWRELSVRYDPDSCSWKTHRCLWDEDLSACSLTLPKWGLMRDGVLLERMTLALPTAANDAGLLPTPLASNTKAHHMRSGGRPARSYWPTPKANDAEKRGNFDTSNPRNGLPAAAKAWPTPVASMSKGSSPASLTRRDGQDRSNDRLDHAVMAADGGQLNPTWVEWLMGWPLGWTDLKPLATDKCRNAQRRHGGF